MTLIQNTFFSWKTPNNLTPSFFFGGQGAKRSRTSSTARLYNAVRWKKDKPNVQFISRRFLRCDVAGEVLFVWDFWLVENIVFARVMPGRHRKERPRCVG
jgi:hypothetical protein